MNFEERKEELKKEIFYSTNKTKNQIALATEINDYRWAKQREEKTKNPPFEMETVASIQEVHPTNKEDLLGAVYGIGVATCEKYGDDIINICKCHYKDSNLSDVKGTGNGKIYRIWFNNDPCQKSYIGQTTEEVLKDRINSHITSYEEGTYKCPLLYKAMDEFGTDNLCFEILEEGIEYKEELDSLELYYIRNYNNTGTLYPNGFNKRYDYQHGIQNMTQI